MPEKLRDIFAPPDELFLVLNYTEKQSWSGLPATGFPTIGLPSS
jgi:hypothetical protein